MVVVHVLDFVAVLPVVLVPHGVLVHGGVGLGRGVEGRRDAVTGLAAVVAVPVVHGAVWIVIWTHSDKVTELVSYFEKQKTKTVLRNGREGLWHQQKKTWNKGKKY